MFFDSCPGIAKMVTKHNLRGNEVMYSVRFVSIWVLRLETWQEKKNEDA